MCRSRAGATGGGVDADAPAAPTHAGVADVDAPEGGRSGARGVRWPLVGGLVCAVALLAFAFVGFAPLSLRSALERRGGLLGLPTDRPYVDEPTAWQAVQSDDGLAAGPSTSRRTFDMEYRAL